MDYNDIQFIDNLLRRIERLEIKIDDLQDRNQKLEKIMRDSFIGFKFNTENKPNHPEVESDEMRRMRLISQILSRG